MWEKEKKEVTDEWEEEDKGKQEDNGRGYVHNVKFLARSAKDENVVYSFKKKGSEGGFLEII